MQPKPEMSEKLCLILSVAGKNQLRNVGLSFHAENSDAMQWMFGGSWKRCPKAFAGLHSNLENGWEREADAIPYTAINPFTLFKAVLSTSPEPNLMKP